MTDSLTAKLSAVQTALKAPKSQYNKFGKYNYRSCEDILEAVKPLLAEHGLTLTLTDELQVLNAGESRVYVKATATVTDGEQKFSVDGYAREALEKKGMDSSQVTGTASSYARKYALNGLFLIDDSKDDDTREPTDKKESKREKSENYTELVKEARKNIVELKARAIEAGVNEGAMKAGVASHLASKSFAEADLQTLANIQRYISNLIENQGGSSGD